MKKGCLFVVAVFFGLMILGKMTPKTPPTPEQRARKEVEDVYYHSLNVVRAGLKAPSTAHFSNFITDAHTGARQRPDGLWESFGSVDSQNSFGAMLRSNWHVIMNPNHTDVLYVKIGEKEVGSLPADPTPTPKAGDWMNTSKRALDQRPR